MLRFLCENLTSFFLFVPPQREKNASESCDLCPVTLRNLRYLTFLQFYFTDNLFIVSLTLYTFFSCSVPSEQ